MSLIWQLGWFFKLHWRRYLVTVIILCMVAVVQTRVPTIIGQMIDSVIQAPDQNSRWELFQPLLLTLLGIGVLVYGLRFVWRVALYGAAYRLGYLLRQKLYQHYLSMDQHFFQQYRSGALMAHVSNDIQAVEMTAGEGILTMVDSVIIGCLVLWIMTTQYSLPLTLLALLPLPIMAFLVARIGRQIHHAFSEAQAAFSDVNNVAHENMSGLRTLRLFAAESYAETQMQQATEQATQANMKVAYADAKFDPVIYLCIGSAYLLAIAGGSWLVWQNQLRIGQLTSFSLYLGQLIWPMFAIAWLFNILERGSAAYQRIQKVLNTTSHLKNNITPIEDSELKHPDIKIDIKRYLSECQIPILSHLNLSIPFGSLVGVVGPTGSGKSSLLRLILRFDDPQDGEISINQRSLKEIHLQQLRGLMSYVPQEPYLFSLSVLDNIRLANSKATREEVIDVAKWAEVHDDIERLPQGYDTQVGERGITLSGGQKQRISLARALLANTPILLLDDALSAIDARTASCILNNLLKLKNQTVIWATHRLQGLEQANQILVLDRGLQVEIGRHQALQNNCGWYSKTWQYQQLEQALSGSDDE